MNWFVFVMSFVKPTEKPLYHKYANGNDKQRKEGSSKNITKPVRVKIKSVKRHNNYQHRRNCSYAEF